MSPTCVPSLEPCADTTATALSWALFVLGQEPHVQAKLQKEIDNYMDAAGTSDMTYARRHTTIGLCREREV